MQNVVNFIKTIEDARLFNSVKQSKEVLNDMLNTKLYNKATDDLTSKIKSSLDGLYVHQKRTRVIPTANNEDSNNEILVTEDGMPNHQEIKSKRFSIFNKLSNSVDTQIANMYRSLP